MSGIGGRKLPWRAMAVSARLLIALAVVGCSAPPVARPAEVAPSAMSAPSALAPLPPTEQGWPYTNPTSQREAQLDRLGRDQGPLKSNWVPPGKSERYGHAEAMISASPDVVKAKLQDFPHYKDLAGPKFKNVRVIDKSATSTSLYFQLPIMKGLITLWYVTSFSNARSVPGAGDVIEGRFVKGNIKNMQIVFTVLPGRDAQSTVVVCDLNLAIHIPAPQEALDEELRDACGDALNAVRAQTTKAL